MIEKSERKKKRKKEKPSIGKKSMSLDTTPRMRQNNKVLSEVKIPLSNRFKSNTA